jgi:hypothetical protein
VIGRHFGSMSDQPCWSGLDVLCQISLVDPCLLKDIASLVSLLSRAERNGDRILLSRAKRYGDLNVLCGSRVMCLVHASLTRGSTRCLSLNALAVE